MKNISIYVHSSLNEPLIKKIKQYYLEKDISSNVFVANDNIIDNCSMAHTATINGTHINWMQGDIVFTSIQDFAKKKNMIIGNPVLVLKKENIIDLTSKIVEECNILIEDSTKIRKIKNAELQHLK